ncbi:disease susceptibility protein LOV1-like isoform X2 [Citrus sinensis]|nr:disease susceptibility protein LOV1-like isoform X2 [Citrus sinensis]
MDVHLGLLSERLKRLLAGEEGTLPVAAKEHIQKLQSGIESISYSLQADYKVDLTRLLLQIDAEADISLSNLELILREIKYLVHESERAIDTFIMSNVQPNGDQSCSKELCDALMGLQSKFIDIKQQLQQVQPCYNFDFSAWMEEQKNKYLLHLQRENRVSFQDNAMEELLDQLIEGPPQLSVVAIIDSCGFDTTDFAAEAYNSNYVKSYFDCRAWVSFDANLGTLLDYILKTVMPHSALREITHKDFEHRKMALNDYLRNKRYLIVLEDVFTKDVWDYLGEALPDHQNGSRVLAMLACTDEIFSLCRLESGEMIHLDSVRAGPLRATYRERPFVFLYYGSKSLAENMRLTWFIQKRSLLFSVAELPQHLKLCCLYLSAFRDVFEISTRQLYQLWIAEGFIPDNSEKTAEEYLEQLISCRFVRVKKRGAGGKTKACYIPIFTRNMLAFVAQFVEFIHIVCYQIRENRSLEITKRLSIFEALINSDSWKHFDTFLRSFLHLTLDRSDRVSLEYCNAICKNFKFLVVLDLGTIVLEEYPTGINHLLLLKYLKLNIPSLKHLPSSLCNLLKLRTLGMPSSYIHHTPDDIWKMNELRHLNVGSITLPEHPGKYSSSLENLNFISALHPSSCSRDILGRLPSLQTLRVHGNLSSYQSMLSNSLCTLLCLESLKLVNELAIVSQPSSIVLPEYQFPPRLVELSLSNTELRDDPMPKLEKLPHLQVLKLKKNSFIGRKLVCSSGGFQSLNVLHLKSMFWLEEWIMENDAMQNLESLVINPCACLKILPEELWQIKSLTKLELRWPRFELREMLRKFEDKEQYDIQICPNGM